MEESTGSILKCRKAFGFDFTTFKSKQYMKHKKYCYLVRHLYNYLFQNTNFFSSVIFFSSKINLVDIKR